MPIFAKEVQFARRSLVERRIFSKHEIMQLAKQKLCGAFSRLIKIEHGFSSVPRGLIGLLV